MGPFSIGGSSLVMDDIFCFPDFLPQLCCSFALQEVERALRQHGLQSGGIVFLDGLPYGGGTDDPAVFLTARHDDACDVCGGQGFLHDLVVEPGDRTEGLFADIAARNAETGGNLPEDCKIEQCMAARL